MKMNLSTQFRMTAFLAALLFLSPIALHSAHAEDSVSKQVSLEEVEIAAKQLLPMTNITVATPTHIQDIFVIHTKSNLFYLHYPTETLIFGEMLMPNDQGEPHFPKEEHQKQGLNRLVEKYREHAFVLGPETAENTIVEFVKPDCVHCREHHSFVSTLKNTKRIVFLVPDDIEQWNENLNHILCSQSPAEDMEKLYQGERLATGDCEGLAQRLEQLRIVAKAFGVIGTPHLIVNNKKVGGFNKEKIYSYLNKDY